MKAVGCQKENLARFVELYNQISLEDPFTGQRSLADFQRDYGRGFEHNVLMIKSADMQIGFLFWSEQRGVVTIEQLFLLPEYRGQGYEDELLTQLIQRYQDSGKKAIQSMISAPDVATGDCYRRLGFTETSQNVQMGLPVNELAQSHQPTTFPVGMQVSLAEREEWQEGRGVYRGLACEDNRYQLRSWNDVKEGSRPEQGKGCFLLSTTDQPIGVLTLNIFPLYEEGQIKQVGQIYELGIIPEMRQQRLGRALLSAGLFWGLENGVEEFRIHLNGLHQSGVDFLASEGFRVKRVISSFTYNLQSEKVAI